MRSVVHSPTAACFECRYPLDGLRSSICPECGRGFNLNDVSTFNRILGDPVELVRLRITDAVALRLLLEREGVHVAMHEQTGGVIGYAELPIGALFVNRDDKSQAEELMTAHLPALQQPPSQDDAWTCSECGERVDPPFEMCWNCGNARPD